MDILTNPSGTDPKKIAWTVNNLLGKYGVNFPVHDVDTIKILLNREGIEMHETVKAKLNAYRSLFISTVPFKEWHVFEKVIGTLIDGISDLEHIQPPHPVELICGCYIISRDIKDPSFSEEVQDYVKTLWRKQYGLVVFHPVVAKLFEEKRSDRKRQIFDEFQKYIMSRPTQFEDTTDPIKVQARRLYAYHLILEHFAKNGEIPLELIDYNSDIQPVSTEETEETYKTTD